MGKNGPFLVGNIVAPLAFSCLKSELRRRSAISRNQAKIIFSETNALGT
jgi:hypothetical protein